MVESYIAASGLAWTNIHPNVVSDSILAQDPPVKGSLKFSVNFGEAKQGWVFASDIAAVAAAVLREGEEKHNEKDYFLSMEILSGPEVAAILSKVSGKEITCEIKNPEDLKGYMDYVPTIPMKAYMESAIITMELAKAGKMEAQLVVKDDVQTVLGRPGVTMEQWAKENLL